MLFRSDFNDDEKWAAEVEKHKFDVVITGNDWTRRCLKKDYAVEEPDFFEPEKYNSTRVRNIIRLRGDWSFLVPNEVYDFVNMKIDSGEVTIDGELEKGKDW